MTPHLPHVAVLDHLRPPPGWRTDRAVLSTYSAHSSVVAAALLALAGQDDESASGTRVGLVRALTELRDNVHIVVQSGRLTLPPKPASVVALFDRFIVQAPFDEGSAGVHNGQSWHAKFALVRYVPADPSVSDERWVFMLGSRNLTLDMSWDLGLVLAAGSHEGVKGETVPQVIAGIGTLAALLAKSFPQLRQWSGLSKAIKQVQWQVPVGLLVAELELMLPGDAARRLPSAPAEVNQLFAVSPFLEGEAVRALGKWGGAHTQRQLLSIRPELSRLAGQAGKALDGYAQLLVLPEPVLDSAADTSLTVDGEKAPADQTGLHAKFIHAEHGAGHTLWLGSANLTQRAWSRNAECVARVEIQKLASAASDQLLAGLRTFADMAMQVQPDALLQQPAEDTSAIKLARARVHVAARLLGAEQKREVGVAIIKANDLPHPVEKDISLFCGRLVEEPSLWPRNTHVLKLPETAELAANSGCLRVRLVLGSEQVEWVQMVEWSPGLDQTRDDAVLSDYLGPRQMLAWIHDVLTGYSNGDEGGSWDDQLKKPLVSSAPAIGLPSLEQALRLWVKDRSRLDEVDRILALWQQRKTTVQTDPKMEEQMQRFARTWGALRSGLAMYKRRKTT